MAVSTAVSRLPYEPLGEIFAYCTKNEPKVARLVCRLWSNVTIPLLCDRIYILSRPQGLVVFREWINHDLCRTAVKQLILDYSRLNTNVEYAASRRLA